MRIKFVAWHRPSRSSHWMKWVLTWPVLFFILNLRGGVGNKVSPEKMRQIKGHIAKVGVFVNMPYDELMRTVEDYRLDMVQLHGDESPHFCEKSCELCHYCEGLSPHRQWSAWLDSAALSWRKWYVHVRYTCAVMEVRAKSLTGTFSRKSAIDKLFFKRWHWTRTMNQGSKEFMKEPVAKIVCCGHQTANLK